MTFASLEKPVSPSTLLAFWIRLISRQHGYRGEGKGRETNVLIVSIGAFENGPIAPEIRPITMVW